MRPSAAAGTIAAWAAAWPKRERLTTAVTDVLLSHCRLQPADKVLDVGTGGGVAALAAARIVGDGTVVGADISAPLIELARRRAAGKRATTSRSSLPTSSRRRCRAARSMP